MATNEFKRKKFVDHEIVDDEGIMVCTIRVKPSGVLWAPKDGKKWRGVSLAEFTAFMETRGKRQEK